VRAYAEEGGGCRGGGGGGGGGVVDDFEAVLRGEEGGEF
jgi:hypothetical protein